MGGGLDDALRAKVVTFHYSNNPVETFAFRRNGFSGFFLQRLVVPGAG